MSCFIFDYFITLIFNNNILIQTLFNGTLTVPCFQNGILQKIEKLDLSRYVKFLNFSLRFLNAKPITAALYKKQTFASITERTLH